MDYKFGLLRASGLNLGDDIQSVVVRSYLPRIDYYLDGCFLHRVKSDVPIKLIIHGRFDSHIRGWPPADCIRPLFISFAFGEYAFKQMLAEDSISYFKKHEPIGCRDLLTRDLLREKGVEAYFSGCVTFMLNESKLPRSNILLTDLDIEAMKHIPKEVKLQSIVLKHGSGVPWEGISNLLYSLSPRLYQAIKNTKIHIALGTLQQVCVKATDSKSRIERRFSKAEELIEEYAKAKLVITSRLHATLPSIALGTPAIFVPRDIGYSRFWGLLDYIRAYQAREFRYKIEEINFENPLPNPRSIDKLRSSLQNKCKEFINEYRE